MSKALSFTTSDADEGRPQIGMAPLVDIVLLLICFYLLVMQSMQARTDDKILLPEMVNNQTSELQPAELVININVDGDVTLNGRAVNIDDLPNVLTTERLRAAEAGQAINAVVRADGRQQFGVMDQALNACREAGLGIVTIRATEGRRR